MTVLFPSGYGLRIPGRIVNTLADESVLDSLGRADAGKLHAFAFDQSLNGYYAIEDRIGRACMPVLNG